MADDEPWGGWAFAMSAAQKKRAGQMRWRLQFLESGGAFTRFLQGPP